MTKPVPASVPRLWPGETVVCLGTGPSLTPADVTLCRERARVIAINDAYQVAPWADALYAADESWWNSHQGAKDFAGLKYTIEPQRRVWPGLQVLENTGPHGLDGRPTSLRTGFNSGYQAIHLAVHFGARRILLLGYDLRGGHFYAAKPAGDRKFAGWLKAYATLVEPLKAAGVEVLNCTPDSALRCFPMASLPDALGAVAA